MKSKIETIRTEKFKIKKYSRLLILIVYLYLIIINKFIFYSYLVSVEKYRYQEVQPIPILIPEN